MKITKSNLMTIIKEEVTNMHRNLREFGVWILEVDGNIENMSKEFTSAEELVPEDGYNLYSMWLDGYEPDAAARELLGY